ncbi:MAG TPA: histidine phosphatase family protein [Acidimicrobiales bacterium]
MWVLRHAKAASQGPDDHSRPLTARGRRQAADVGSYLASDPLAATPVPELVLSSSARRAVQTAELVVAALEPGIELVVESALYDADPDDVVEVIRAFGGDAPSVLVVGHNPTMQELAVLLVDAEHGDGRPRLERRFPTAALAVTGVRADSWARLILGTGSLLALRTPDP